MTLLLSVGLAWRSDGGPESTYASEDDRAGADESSGTRTQPESTPGETSTTGLPAMEAEAERQPEPERDANWRETVIGRWKTYYRGRRHMIVRKDGTATIVAHLTDYTAIERSLVGASRVTFEVEWTIENGALHWKTVGGEPEASVDVVTRIYGSEKTYPIAEITDAEFRYRSDDPGKPDYVWERVEEAG